MHIRKMQHSYSYTYIYLKHCLYLRFIDVQEFDILHRISNAWMSEIWEPKFKQKEDKHIFVFFPLIIPTCGQAIGSLKERKRRKWISTRIKMLLCGPWFSLQEISGQFILKNISKYASKQDKSQMEILYFKMC